ncbi:hypothetical protein BKA67DRAFT_535971 [Truncatella angustata]|uniref:N-acetyltransferase domain-containing protein n=1 Tax=Truncatella angustata TaxID=152316 RepID=A0A9P8UMH7_9PEZI|nr:uncharacterized protein BKA67DRAFT_535971 [Truncatella angustata]KAH6654660.1 hypothetical protein BKA67DRAFT_535971 [Truncatella angustata]
MLAELPTPKSLSPDFALSPITPDDIDGLITCHHNAFSSPAERYWWAPDLGAMRVFQRRTMALNLTKPGRRYYKITHRASGKVAAWTTWVLPKGFESLGGVPAAAAAADNLVVGGGEEVVDVEEATKDKLEGLSPQERARKIVEQIDPPEGATRDALELVIQQEEEMHQKYGVEELILLALLCTDPAFERRGLARALVEPMLAVAEAEGVPVWVEGSPKGAGFYEKMGFETIETTEIDLGRGNKGLTGNVTMWSMKWTPRATPFEAQ